jgi:hypothetical protein
MTVSEYEEQFRTPAPSWHQIVTGIGKPNPTLRRKRRLVTAAILLGAIAMIAETASYYNAGDHTCKKVDTMPAQCLGMKKG